MRALALAVIVGLLLSRRSGAVARPGRWFSWAELDPTNTRNPEQAANGVRLAAMLDELRDAVGPLRVTSGLRSPTHNAEVGGAEGSAHLDLRAADLVSLAGLSSSQIADAAVSIGLPVDQLIWYDAQRGGHVHLGIARAGEAPRLEVRHGTAGTDSEPLDTDRTEQLRGAVVA